MNVNEYNVNDIFQNIYNQIITIHPERKLSVRPQRPSDCTSENIQKDKCIVSFSYHGESMPFTIIDIDPFCFCRSGYSSAA